MNYYVFDEITIPPPSEKSKETPPLPPPPPNNLQRADTRARPNPAVSRLPLPAPSYLT